MPNFNSILGGLANVASQIKGSQGSNQNNQGGSSPYPNSGSGYQGGSSGYPNQGDNSAYPNQGGSSGYPNQGSNSPYPGGYGSGQNQPSAYQGYGGPQGGPQGQNQGYGSGSYQPAGYPSGPSQYPQPSGNTPYPSSGSAAPYPSGNTTGFPQGPGAGAYGSNPPYPGSSPYPSNNSPYPSNNSPYPSNPTMGSGYGAPPPQQSPYGQSVYPNIGQGAPSSHQPSAPPQYQTSYVPTMNNTPSIRPVPSFNPNADAETLRKAMKGFGCNNDKVVAVLCQRSNWQRQEIAKAF